MIGQPSPKHATSYLGLTCQLTCQSPATYDLQSLECHVSPPEWCHVPCQPSPKPPPDHRSTAAINGGSDGQRRRTTVDHRGTTAGPPVNHQSTIVDRQSTAGQQPGLDRVMGQ
ncbi:hypothetical protein Tco_0061720, partial [Tanacetum coccineum]